MIPTGSLVVVFNDDLKESYIAELLEDLPAWHRLSNPLVRILWMLRYPIQTAIMDGSILNENPPLPRNTRLRMACVCRWPLPELPGADYQHSVDAAREDYAQEAAHHQRQDILKLLAAHAQGLYRRKRTLPPLRL